MRGRRKNRKSGRRRNSIASGTSSRRQDDRNPDARRYSDPIPLDLTIDILARLPVKSLVRFRCVSNLWSSIIRSRHFVNSFLSRSPTRPHLLVTFPDHFHLERRLFSSPHPQNPGVRSSSVAIHDLTVPGFTHYYVSKSLNGLICLEVENRLRICNPSTRQFVTVPRTETEFRPSSDYSLFVTNVFGYDPVNDQYKVLNTMVFKSDDRKKKMMMEHRIFTLGDNSWRRIEDSLPHSLATDGLCINGVVYYGAWTNMDNLDEGSTIVAFNVGLEKFKFIKTPSGYNGISFHDELLLINCRGKLAVLNYFKLKTDDEFDLWVLEDEDKEKWSKKIHAFPSSWREFVGEVEYYIAGTIYTGEIILAPRSLSNPFYVFYYDMKRSRVRRVEIEGMPDHEFRLGNGLGNAFSFLTFTDHVESIMFF